MKVGPPVMLPAFVLVLVVVLATLTVAPATIALVAVSAALGALVALWGAWRALPPNLRPLAAGAARARVRAWLDASTTSGS